VLSAFCLRGRLGLFLAAGKKHPHASWIFADRDYEDGGLFSNPVGGARSRLPYQTGYFFSPKCGEREQRIARPGDTD